MATAARVLLSGAAIGVRQGYAGEAIAKPMLENWPLFGQNAMC